MLICKSGFLVVRVDFLGDSKRVLDLSLIVFLGIIRLICNLEGYLSIKINFVRYIFFRSFKMEDICFIV